MKRRDEKIVYLPGYISDEVASALLMAPDTGGSVRETINGEEVEVEVNPLPKLTAEELSKSQELSSHVVETWNAMRREIWERQRSKVGEADGFLGAIEARCAAAFG